MYYQNLAKLLFSINYRQIIQNKISAVRTHRPDLRPDTDINKLQLLHFFGGLPDVSAIAMAPKVVSVVKF
jgi:hypothetical protein